MAGSVGGRIERSGLVLSLVSRDLQSYPGTGTSWFDLSGNANDGSLSSVTYSTDMSFNGSNSYVSFNTIDFGNQLTVSCLFNPATTNNIQTIFANSAAGSATNGIRLFFNGWQTSSRIIYVEVGNGSTSNSFATSSAVVVNGVWQQITFVLNKTSQTGVIYYNGVSVASGSLTVNYNSNAGFRLGLFPDGQFPLNASVSNYTVYNRALSAREVLGNFNVLRTRHGI